MARPKARNSRTAKALPTIEERSRRVAEAVARRLGGRSPDDVMDFLKILAISLGDTADDMVSTLWTKPVRMTRSPRRSPRYA